MTRISDHGELDHIDPTTGAIRVYLTDDDKIAASGFLAAIHERRKQLNAQDRDREIRENERAIANFHFPRFMP